MPCSEVLWLCVCLQPLSSHLWHHSSLLVWTFPPSLCHLSQSSSSSPTLCSPCLPSAPPVCLTLAEAQGVKFNSQMTEAKTLAAAYLRYCICVLAPHLLSGHPPPNLHHIHTNMFEYTHISISSGGQDPCVSNLALNVAISVNCEERTGGLCVVSGGQWFRLNWG